MNQYDPTVDLKINVGHCDLYFMAQYISWPSDFMLHFEDTFMYVFHSLGLCDLYFIDLLVCFISPTI